MVPKPQLLPTHNISQEGRELEDDNRRRQHDAMGQRTCHVRLTTTPHLNSMVPPPRYILVDCTTMSSNEIQAMANCIAPQTMEMTIQV